MSYVTPGVGESFVFRVRKTLNASPDVHWFNTYEARFTVAGTSADLDSLAAGLVEFEAELHYNVCTIDQVTISTWEEDSHPYNPLSFVTQPYAEAGRRALGAQELLDLRVCWFVKRLVTSGRIGRLFFRAALSESDVNSFAGTFRLADVTGMNTILLAAIAAGGLSSNTVDGMAQPTLALIGALEVTRFLTGFSQGGVAVVKLNHKYFDRA